MKYLLEKHRAYIAGVTDGEGTIGLSRRVKSNGTITYNPFVSVENTYKELLLWLEEVTGIGDVIPHSKQSKRHRLSWCWWLKVEEMVPFLEAILPFLVVKDEQARLLLEYLALPGRERGEDVDWKITQGREFICQELAKLNKRGLLHVDRTTANTA